MSGDRLTADQEELLDEIESTEPSEKATGLLERCVEAFDYTATLLTELAALLRSEGDHDGADMVLEFAGEMAKHEARTL